MITNLLIELRLGTMCSSIIYKNRSNKIYLLSNLDWDFEDLLMISRFKLVVLNNIGEVKYEALAYFGSTGFVRVQTNKWSLAYNIIEDEDHEFNIWGYTGVMEMISEAADKDLEFEDAINFFKNSRNNIGGYYNIISKDKGCILSKSMFKQSELECIDDEKTFLVQMNDPRSIISRDRRYAEEKMISVKNYLDVFKIWTRRPIFKRRHTNFTTISTVSKYFKYIIHTWEENIIG